MSSWTKALARRYVHQDPGFVRKQKCSTKTLRPVVPIFQEDREVLEKYKQLQGQCEKPSFGLALAALKVCRKTRDLQMGRKIHKDLEETGNCYNAFVGSTLVSMYAKCGCMIDAYGVFQSVQEQDAVLWNCMIMGYAENGQGETALELFVRMRDQGFKQERVAFLGALRACTSLGEKEKMELVQGRRVKRRCLELGKALHAQAAAYGCLDLVVENTLVDLYGKCGSMVDARQVFDIMPEKNVVSWNCIIMGYADNGQSGEALELFSRLRDEDGIAPDRVTTLAALKACAALVDTQESDPLVREKCLEKCRDINYQVPRSGNEIDLFVASSLLNLYAKCGGLAEAARIFEEMKHRDVVSWNCFISGCAQSGEAEQALQLYQRMQDEGCVPNSCTFLGSLKACVSLAEREEGQLVNGKLIKVVSLSKGKAVHVRAAGSFHDVMVANAVMDMYAKCGSMTEAALVFKEMPCRDVVSWTTMIQGYAENGEADEALKLYRRFVGGEGGFKPDAITFVAALKACITLAEREEGRLVERKVVKLESLQIGKHVHNEASRFLDNGFPGFLSNALVDVYCKCGSTSEARRVFDKMSGHDVASWTLLIQGYTENDEGEEALQLYSQMQRQGVTPSMQTYIAAMKACGSVANLDAGMQIHSDAMNAGFEGNAIFATSLVDCYAKCGSMAEAEKCFDAIASRDVACWNALLAGYSRQGDMEHTVEVFQSMLGQRMRPNDITFLSILTACSHAGHVDQGKRYFVSMTSEYGIPPRIEHFNCMVDLLGRGNRLEEAEELLRSMPFEASNVTWRSLLAAARKWKNVAVGERAFGALLKSSERSNAAIYGQMASIYASVGMLAKAERIRALRRMEAGITKKPGQSWWIDRQGRLHSFAAVPAGIALKQRLITT